MNSKFYKTAGITVEVRSEFPISENTFHPKFRKFEVDGPGEDNVLIQHYFHPPPPLFETGLDVEEVYDKDQWRIFRVGNAWRYDFKSILPIDPGHRATGIFNEDYTSLSVYTNDFDITSYQNAVFSSLTLFNNDQVLFAPLLCNRNGLILHSNGFDINGNGVLLAGASGVGKSTLSGMLKKHGFNILCDDRMFVTSENSGYKIHGNWCHGTVPDTGTGSLPLKAILFLEQSKNDAIEEIVDRKGIARYLLQTLVHPFLEPSGWDKTFNVIERLVRGVECYRLKFNLSGTICHMINQHFYNRRTQIPS
jgi:hypothetical protein